MTALIKTDTKLGEGAEAQSMKGVTTAMLPSPCKGKMNNAMQQHHQGGQ